MSKACEASASDAWPVKSLLLNTELFSRFGRLRASLDLAAGSQPSRSLGVEGEQIVSLEREVIDALGERDGAEARFDAYAAAYVEVVRARRAGSDLDAPDPQRMRAAPSPPVVDASPAILRTEGALPAAATEELPPDDDRTLPLDGTAPSAILPFADAHVASRKAPTLALMGPAVVPPTALSRSTVALDIDTEFEALPFEPAGVREGMRQVTTFLRDEGSGGYTVAPGSASGPALPFPERERVVAVSEVDLSLFPIERYVEVTTRLAGGEPRAAVLRAVLLTEAMWSAAANAWAERIQSSPELRARYLAMVAAARARR